MRRINIKYGDKLETKSFDNVGDFEKYIHAKFNFDEDTFLVAMLAHAIWDKNVGASCIYNSSYYGKIRFSIQSKARAGNYINL